MRQTPVFPVLLRTSRQNLRINRRKTTSATLQLGASTLKFTNALLNRYLDRSSIEPQINLTLRRVIIGVAIQHQHQHHHTNITPQLALTVLGWPARSDSMNHSIEVPFEPGLRVRHETRFIKTITLKRETRYWEQLVEQIVERKKRVEINSEPSIVPSSVIPMQEVKRVVRRGAASATDQKLTANDLEPKTEAKLLERKTNNSVDRSYGASIDVNRLTDQVIQAIDHRIIAQRERLGRV